MPTTQVVHHPKWMTVLAVLLVLLLATGCRSFTLPIGLPVKLCVSPDDLPNASYSVDVSIESISYAKTGSFTIFAKVLATIETVSQTASSKHQGTPCDLRFVLDIYNESRKGLLTTETKSVERGEVTMFLRMGGERVYYSLRPLNLPAGAKFACHRALETV